MKVLVAAEKAFAPVAINQIHTVIEAAGYELVLLESYKDISDLLVAVSDADAMIVCVLRSRLRSLSLSSLTTVLVPLP